MPRLPTVNGDNNDWGTILNDYLSVAHNANGTIKQLGIENLSTTLTSKADLVSGTVPTNQLPGFYFDAANFSGTGTSSDQIKLNTASIAAYLQSLPGFAPGKVLQADLTWITPSGSSQSQLSTPTLTLGTPATTSISASWTAVTNATSYTLQCSTDNTNWTTIYTGNNTSYSNTGLTSSTLYYYRLKATATGYADSNYATAQATTATASNNAPVASNVAFTGTATEGQMLTGSYTYSDAESNAEGTSIKKWYRSDNTSALNRTAISGATNTTYVLTSNDVGKYIQYAVTPVASAGTTTGTEVFSSYSGSVGGSGGNLIDITSWPYSQGSIIISGNDLSTSVIEGDIRAASTKYIAAGNSGYVQAISAYGTLGLDNDDGYAASANEFSHAIYMSHDGSGKIICYTGIGSVYYSDNITGRPSSTIVRLRADGSFIHYEYSINSGTSWIDAKSATQDNFNLYVKAYLYGGALNDIAGNNLN